MRLAIVALGLLTAIARTGLPHHEMPAIVATAVVDPAGLPRVDPEALEATLKRRFPPGSSAREAMAELERQGFLLFKVDLPGGESGIRAMYFLERNRCYSSFAFEWRENSAREIQDIWPLEVRAGCFDDVM